LMRLGLGVCAPDVAARTSAAMVMVASFIILDVSCE
jgi:hypothetical protein